MCDNRYLSAYESVSKWLTVTMLDMLDKTGLCLARVAFGRECDRFVVKPVEPAL